MMKSNKKKKKKKKINKKRGSDPNAQKSGVPTWQLPRLPPRPRILCNIDDVKAK